MTWTEDDSRRFLDYFATWQGAPLPAALVDRYAATGRRLIGWLALTPTDTLPSVRLGYGPDLDPWQINTVLEECVARVLDFIAHGPNSARYNWRDRGDSTWEQYLLDMDVPDPSPT